LGDGFTNFFGPKSPSNYLACSVVAAAVSTVAVESVIGAAAVVSAIGTTAVVSTVDSGAFFSSQEAKAKTVATDSNANTFLIIVIVYSLFSVGKFKEYFNYPN
jgi:hypothetical protein